MKVSRFPHRKESETAGAPALRRRAPRTARLALLAVLVLLLLAGVVRISVGAPAPALKRVPAFRYSYRVLEVNLRGLFVTTINDEGLAFSGREEIWVWGALKGEKTQSRPVDLPEDDDLLAPLPPEVGTFTKGTLTLQSPASDIGVNCTSGSSKAIPEIKRD